MLGVHIIYSDNDIYAYLAKNSKWDMFHVLLIIVWNN